MKFGLALGAIVLTVVCATVAATATVRIDPGDCIRGAERFERQYDRIAATIDSRVYNIKVFDDSDGMTPPDRLVRQLLIKYWRDDRRARTLERCTYRSLNQGKLVDRLESTEWLVTPELSVGVSRDPTTQKFEGPNLTATLPGPENDPLLRLLSGVGMFVFGGRIDVLGPTLSTSLADAKLTLVNDQVGGHNLARLDFENSWGIHAVWFDPTRDFNPVRATQRKESRHWVRPNVALATLPDNPSFGRITEMEQDITVSGFRKVKDVWFVDAFEATLTMATSRSLSAETKTVTRVAEISSDPTSGGNRFVITTVVPNGTPVVVQGQLPIMYEWKDGSVNKAVNKPAAEVLAKQEFKRTSWWWVWPAVFVLIAFCVAVWVHRRRSMASRGVH